MTSRHSSPIRAAELVETLQGEGPFTVFAPTKAAFEALPEGTVGSLHLPENKEKLRGIPLYHVHAGVAVMAADVSTTSLETANGQSVSIEVTDAGAASMVPRLSRPILLQATA